MVPCLSRTLTRNKSWIMFSHLSVNHITRFHSTQILAGLSHYLSSRPLNKFSGKMTHPRSFSEVKIGNQELDRPEGSTTTVAAGNPHNSLEEDPEDSADEEYQALCLPFLEWVSEKVERAGGEEIKDSKDGWSETEAERFNESKARWRQCFAEMPTERAQQNMGYSGRSVFGTRIGDHSSRYLTDPPLRILEVEVLDEKKPAECPCCLGYAETDIVIDCEKGHVQGITEDRFLWAICQVLYGKGVEMKDLPLRQIYSGPLVVKSFDNR